MGDFDGDGALDLAVSNGSLSASRVSVLPGIGDGNFSPERRFRVSDFPISLAVGDFNGDGLPDLAVGFGDFVHDVSILLNDTY